MGKKNPTTLKLEQEIESHLASEVAGVDRKQKLDPMSSMVSGALDTAISCRLVGLRAPQVDPSTGLAFDSVPSLVAERTGLEELDVQEIHRHRYDGQYPGKPRSHYLGGSDDITFGNNGGEISERWNRVRNHAVASAKQKTWREAYHQVGFIADRLNMPEPVREDVCRAYANLREQEISEAYSLEKLLGLLTYTACRIHDYPRNFDDVKEAIDELYGLKMEKENISGDMVKAFNKGPIRFGINNQDGYQYLHTWKTINGRKISHRSLGSL